MAKKIPSTVGAQWLSLASLAPFYVVMLSYSWQPGWYTHFFGGSAWYFQVLWLSLNALLSLVLFFWSSIKAAETKFWHRTTLLNAFLLSIPLYFLWLRFMN